jgi:hypothetical protein
MSGFIECVVAGGPQHGAVFLRSHHDKGGWPVGVECSDGHICNVAACRPSRTALVTRLVFLHPLASGDQFLAVLGAPSGEDAPGGFPRMSVAPVSSAASGTCN